MLSTKSDMFSTVCTQLAIDLNCSPEDFNKSDFIFCEAKENPGRRPFPRGERHFEMLTMGKSVIVSATPDILTYVKDQLDGKSRDEAFNMSFVHGQGIYFLPDIENIKPVPEPDNVSIKMVEPSDISKLYIHKGFEYAIWYEPHIRPEALVSVAYINDIVVGMAGASDDCKMMWQIGLDVLPEYRNLGIATALTNRLAIEIMKRGKVPYYGTASSNIASQRVAHRAGFTPAWTCAWRGKFEDELTEPTS